eukprot:586953-Pelagomonas_calceolata.AAC.2
MQEALVATLMTPEEYTCRVLHKEVLNMGAKRAKQMAQTALSGRAPKGCALPMCNCLERGLWWSQSCIVCGEPARQECCNDAMAGMGTDEKAMIQVSVPSTLAQRPTANSSLWLMAAFLFGRPLAHGSLCVFGRTTGNGSLWRLALGTWRLWLLAHGTWNLELGVSSTWHTAASGLRHMALGTRQPPALGSLWHMALGTRQPPAPGSL